jgi:outer membrane protein assembly factor BamB
MSTGAGKSLRGLLAIIAGCLLVCGCELPRERPVTEEAERPVSAVQKSRLDPASPDLDFIERGLKVLWRQDLGEIAEGNSLRDIYYTNGLLLAETPDGNLFCFDAKTGIWTGSARLKSTLWVDPVRTGDRLSVMTARGIMTIDLSSGLTQKQFPARMPVSSDPVSYDGSLIFGAANGKCFRIHLNDGTFAWTRAAGGAVYEKPVLGDELLYLAGYGGQAVCLEVDTGKMRWGWEPGKPSKLTSGVALTEESVYVGDNRGFLYSLTTADGLVMWKFPVGGPVHRAPSPAGGGKLLVYTYKGPALCLDVKEGPTFAWRYPDVERMLGRGKENLYLLSRDKTLCCVGRERGEEKWQLPLVPGSLVTSEPDSPQLFFADPDGQILALTELD